MAKLYKEIDKSLLVAIPNPSKEAYEIKIKIPELEIFYNMNNKFKINKEMGKLLRYLFLYRMVILTLQNFKIRDSFQIKILDNVIERLKKCYEIN